MNCPRCGTANSNQNRFCLRCGTPLTATQSAQTNQAWQAPPVEPLQQPVQQPPAFDPTLQKNGTRRLPQQSFAPPLPQTYSNHQPSQEVSSAQVVISGMNIWGPFAGYGTRRRHIGWLMDNQAGRYQDLIKSVYKRLTERRLSGMNVAWKQLTAKGLLVETRPYLIVTKGLVSLALNVGPFGKDLFISMATYLKPPFSNFRRILAAISGLLLIFGGPLMASMSSAAFSSMTSQISLFGGYNSGPDLSFLFFPVFCIIGPIWAINGFLFPFAFFFSVYKWMTEKDFWALLRVKPNEFNEDDLMALEKAVEQTIRSGLDDIGLNPAELKPTAVQGNEQRLI